VTTVLIAVVLGVAALGVAALINRRRPPTAPAAGPHIPGRVDRRDFSRPDAAVLVVVFTSATCASCAAMVATARAEASDVVVVDEVEAGERAEIHRRYEIDSVPILVVADRTGVVRASFAGTVTREALEEALVGLH
jgi:Thioredoxin